VTEAVAFCRVCGRRLTAPESVKAGIGPVCAKRLERGDPLAKMQMEERALASEH